MYDYYHKSQSLLLSFIIPPKSTILVTGFIDVKTIKLLDPKYLVVIVTDINEYKKLKRSNTRVKLIRRFVDYIPKRKFEYIILNGTLGKANDIMGLLSNIQGACTPATRMIVYQHNYLWQWILNLAERFNLKRKEGVHNWLCIADIKSYLYAAGFDPTRIYNKTLLPVNPLNIGKVVNGIFAVIPFFDRLKLDQYIITRPMTDNFSKSKPESLTICLTVRNERENIEPVVKSLPILTKNQEIIFVEGNSSDGTREEVLRVIKKYPKKNIRVMGQPGKGQGDAIRVGFKAAKGDIVILYEGDQTSDPDDLKYFYEAIKNGRFEFIEGSRFVYPLTRKEMSLSKQIGNIFFAKWFSFFLGQNSTDVLSGIKAITKVGYEKVYSTWGSLGVVDPFGDFELLYGSVRHGLKIGEVPMRYYPRVYGKPMSSIWSHGPILMKMAFEGYWIFRSK